MAKVQTQRGLKNYIQELRACTTREAEKERVDKEMGKIRKKYTSDKAMSAYDKRKYMWKLLYTRLIGYDVEFGQKQAMDLLAASGFAEKQVGYVACSVFLNEKDELLRLVINSVRNDLISRNEVFQCLALDFIANVGGAEFAQLLTSDVMNVLTNGATRPAVRKKAALCLLRLIRKAPPDAEIMLAEDWSVKMAALLEDRDPGVLLGLTTLLLGVVSRNYQGYEPCIPHLVRLLERLKARDVTPDYTYYGIASPWLQVRVLRTLQYFPPPEDPVVLRSLTDAVRRMLASGDAGKNVNKGNALHAIVFEAVALAVGLGDPELLNMGVGLLAKFLTVREANLKYLALENLGRLAEAPEVAESVARHQKTVVSCLQDTDVSIRRRALDLVFATCTAASAPDIVEELLKQLPKADYSSREDIVLKAAVLGERFLPSREWYVDSMLRLMESAGDAATDDIWQSVAQVVSGDSALQAHAAAKVCEGLQRGANSQVFLRCAAFLLGEYGGQLAARGPQSTNGQTPTTAPTPLEQFKLLYAQFPGAAPESKAMLLSAFGKMRAAHAADPAVAAAVDDVLQRYGSAADVELQQRATEFLALLARPGAAAAALQPLPPWERRSSLLLKRLAEREGEGEDEARELPAWVRQETHSSQSEHTQEAAAAGVTVLSVSAEDTAQQEREAGLEVEEAAVVTPSATAASAAAGVNGGMDLMDLLDLNESEEPSSQPLEEPQLDLGQLEQEQEQQSDAAELAALGAVGGSTANPFAEPVPAAAAPAGPSIQPIGDLGAWFRHLCLSSSGVLYEDAYLQLGVKLEVAGATATAGLFLGNKSRDPLQRLVCMVTPSPAFTMQLGALPPVLEPGKQIHLPLVATCIAPFTHPPVLQLGYTLGSTGLSLARSLEVPLVLSKFCQPVDVPAEIFVTRWGQVVGAPFKLSERMVKSMPGGGINPDSVAATLTALHLRVLTGVDPDPGCVPAACVFHCGQPQGQAKQVPCMVKVQGLQQGSSEVVVTVATADAMATDGLKALLVRLLRPQI